MRYNKSEKQRLKEGRRILIIGDLHEPFCLPDYLAFCKAQYKKFKCNQVVFIGDVIDSHASSFHDLDPDGMSAGDELDLSIKKLKPWVKAFPIADVCIGNHDRIVARKAFSAGVSKHWIKSYSEVLQAPGWTFSHEFIYDGVKYHHGEGGTARTAAKNDMISVVQGHIHTQAYCEHLVGANYRVFGMQVGCGIDRESYAAAYAKNYKKQAIGCAVVLDGGQQPINILANLNNNKIIL